MANIDKQKIGTDFIVIKDKLSGLVTITTEDLSEQNLSNNFIYKVCPDGEILNVGIENKKDEKLVTKKKLEKMAAELAEVLKSAKKVKVKASKKAEAKVKALKAALKISEIRWCSSH